MHEGNSVRHDVLAAVVTLKEYKMGYFLEPIQYLHSFPNFEDLKTPFYQAIDAQKLRQML